ncbi:MAG: hypothetical protein GYA51_03985 [Candidatus Methanofastidiosa archaeon]|jgi:transcriptional regulator NrdR family protein|nr:hypothetical protein [Candidatus Methanofastidiosa archaeon]
MTYVIKNDGRVERFDEEKLKSSIYAAAREAGLLDERWVEAILQSVASNAISYSRGQRAVETKTLKEMIITELLTLAKQVATAWLAYDKTYKTKA